MLRVIHAEAIRKISKNRSSPQDELVWLFPRNRNAEAKYRHENTYQSGHVISEKRYRAAVAPLSLFGVVPLTRPEEKQKAKSFFLLVAEGSPRSGIDCLETTIR
jgi:hypothetical protein